MSAATWLLDALIASALLIAAVLVVRGPVRRVFGPQIAYALWVLPALRLLLPPLPVDWWRAAAAPVTRAGETVATVLVIEVTEPMAAQPVPLGLALALAWGLGAAGFLGWHLLRHARFCRSVIRTGAPMDRHGDVTVIASPVAPGPLAFGVWRRFVAFPSDFAERYDTDERALALAHELGHHARRDLLANQAALVVLALHWFNPLAWRAFAAFRADQELANDARVLAGCAPADRHAYGRAIVKAAHGRAVCVTCHLHTVSDLKGRLKMLTISRASRRRLAVGSAAVAMLVAGGLGLTASSTAAERIAAKIDTPAAPPPVQAASPAATPPAPSASPVPSAPSEVRKTRVVVVAKDGKTETFEGADADKYIADNKLPIPPVPPIPPRARVPGEPMIIVQRLSATRDKDGKPTSWSTLDMPTITSADCKGDKGPSVETSVKDGKRVTVICRNRMGTRIAALERGTGWFERNSIWSAQMGLNSARANIVGNRDLTDDQRKQALAGIDQALAELGETPRKAD